MPKLKKRELIAVKVETTQGIDATPSATNDAVLVENLSWSFANARMVERGATKPTLGKLQAVHAGTLFEVSFDAELKGSGSAGTAPEIGPVLRACGMAETINAGTSVVYDPASTDHESVTIYLWEDGSVYRVTGAKGTASLAANTGEIGKFSITLTGHFGGLVDEALPAATYDSTVPPAVIGTSFSVGAFGAVINAVSVDLGNEVTTPPSMTSADGFGSVLITDRDVTGSFDPEATLVADQDWVSDWQNGATQAIDLSIGSDAGNQFALSIPTAYYKEISGGDRDGVATYEIGFGAAGDDAAVSFTFS
jgi:hypothetical protein